MLKMPGLLAVIVLASALVSTSCGGGESNPFSVKSELVTKAQRPVALAFAPDGRLFYTEQYTGNIRVITADGRLQTDPFAHVDTVVKIDWGLTGLALDTQFEKNHYVYAYFTKEVDPEPQVTAKPAVMRFTDRDGHGVEPKVITENFPQTPVERPGLTTIGSIHFGPDGYLYLTVGDYDKGKTLGPGGKFVALDLTTPLGKMLRINKEDGSAAPDNPFVGQAGADPRIFAYGFYSPFNFTFHPGNGQLYGRDNTGSCEELNIVKAGGDYGWPDVGDFPWPDCLAGTQIKAIYFFAREGMKPGQFLSPAGVSGMAFVTGDGYPLLKDSLLVCEVQTKLMRRLQLTGTKFDQVAANDVVIKDCQFDLAVSPDGKVYYSNETEIRRLVQQPIESPN